MGIFLQQKIELIIFVNCIEVHQIDMLHNFFKEFQIGKFLGGSMFYYKEHKITSPINEILNMVSKHSFKSLSLI